MDEGSKYFPRRNTDAKRPLPMTLRKFALAVPLVCCGALALLWFCWGGIFVVLMNLMAISEFTFTDAVDFAPIGSLCLLVGWFIALALHPEWRVPKGLLLALMGALALWPLWEYIGLYPLALQAQKMVGHWPQLMVDDPKGLLKHAASYDYWYRFCAYCMAFGGVAMICFLVGMFALKPRLSSFLRTGLWLLCFAGLVVSFFDPGGLIAWWLD